MELSVLTGVSFCGCPNADNVFLIGITIQSLWKTLPTSTYDYDGKTCHTVLHPTNIASFLKNMLLGCSVFVR